jgi:NADPH:quinone reductase-like Zn-dependent oxidoreductase
MASTTKIPHSAAALVVREGKSVFKYDAVLEKQPLPPKLEPGQLLLKMTAAAFNHRDVRVQNSMASVTYIDFDLL